MPSKPSDQLPAAIEHLRTWASAQRVAWVPGLLNQERGEIPQVHFAADHTGQEPLASAQAFARTLGELDVAMLVVSILTLDEDSQAAAVALYEQEPELIDGPTGREARALVKAMLADARAAHNHIGEPGSVVVTAITRNPTMAITWSEMAEWYMVIDAADMAYSDMDDDDGDDRGEDGDYEEWEEVEPEPEPPVPPRRRIEPRR